MDTDWWVFSKISEDINYPVFMANAEEIGYKRGATREEKRPNELFNSKEIDDQRVIEINIEKPEKIIDFLIKEVQWK